MVPVLAAPPKTPSTYHLTPVLVVPVTVAVNCFVVFVGTLALVGEMEIATCACTEAVAVNATKQSAISERRRAAGFATRGVYQTERLDIEPIQIRDMRCTWIRCVSCTSGALIKRNKSVLAKARTEHRQAMGGVRIPPLGSS